MNIKSHGAWERYTPGKLPEGAPAGAMFSRRVGDGVDWYDYVNSGRNFAPDSVKMVATNNIVGAAGYDPVRLFPGSNSVVLEVTGGPAGDPQAVFGRKVYDPASNTLNYPPKQDFGPSIPELLKRLEALEGKKP
jgi:hypothetical protein